MGDSNMTNCKTCNAPIEWKQENGKYVPYEPDKVTRHFHRPTQDNNPSPAKDTRPSNGSVYIGPDMEREIRRIVRDEFRKLAQGVQV